MTLHAVALILPGAEQGCSLRGPYGCVLGFEQVPDRYEYRYQHGDDPEHSLFVPAVALITAEDSPALYVERLLRNWLHQVHEYEAGEGLT